MNQKQKDVAKNILIGLGVVGILSVVIVAPGLTKVIPTLAKVDVRRINQELKRLQERGLIVLTKRRNGLTSLKLTKDGKDKLKSLRIDLLKIKQPQKWDGKWRVVIFDISVKKNVSRALLRRKMKNLGFYKLQNSVFVHPYPCLEVVTFLRSYFGVESDVEYMEVMNLESQDKLLGHFFT